MHERASKKQTMLMYLAVEGNRKLAKKSKKLLKEKGGGGEGDAPLPRAAVTGGL